MQIDINKYYLNFIFSLIYSVSRLFFLVQTVDHSKHYAPENKIIIDIPAGLNIFGDTVGILKHVQELTRDLADRWNNRYVNNPKVSCFSVAYTFFVFV